MACDAQVDVPPRRKFSAPSAGEAVALLDKIGQ
jgi:hypothetical protein